MIRAKRPPQRWAGDETLGQVLAEWLRYYGPVRPQFVSDCFGIPRERLDSILEDLVEEELVVLDRLLAGSEELLLCDRENLEALLRISRSQARPMFQALPVQDLPYFLARRSGVVERGSDLDSLKARLERLFGYALPARLWEEEVLPARMNGYRSRWLDSLLSEAGLLWLGFPKKRIAFCLKQDVELFTAQPCAGEEEPNGGPASSEPERATAFFPSPAGRYSFWDLSEVTHVPSEELSRRLWELAWAARASSDTFESVRRGLATGFQAEPAADGTGPRRRGFDRWQSSRPSSGYWFLLESGTECRDALEEEELARDRIRIVLQRYGVVFRELLDYELPELRWSRLFRSLRLMEFSGEVVAGRFFEGAGGIQFALPAALEELRTPADDQAVWWINAADPASLCGVELPGLKAFLPSRLPTTHLVFQGKNLVLISRRMGRELEIKLPTDSSLAEYLGFLRTLTDREQRAMSAIRVETINGEPAARSPYRQSLLEAGLASDYRGLVYRARV